MAKTTLSQGEALEQRRVLTLDFVSAYVEEGTPFYITNVTSDAELSESVQQLTLSFTPGSVLDGSSHSLDGIKVYRSGGSGDEFSPMGSLPDELIEIGALVVDDAPNENQIVIRFANQLVDDDYKIEISSSISTRVNEYTGLSEQSISGLRSFVGSGENHTLENPVVIGATAIASETESQDVIQVDSTSELTEGMLVFRSNEFIGSVLSVMTANTFRMSNAVTLSEETELVFETIQVTLTDSTGVVPGMLVIGSGIAGGTTVVENDLNDGIVTLSAPVEADIEATTSLRFVTPEPFRSGDTSNFEFRVSLGQQITSVVPQPVERGAHFDDNFGLSQRKNIIDVYFDNYESLDKDSVEVASKYKLIKIDPATGADDNTTPALEPTRVNYVVEEKLNGFVHKARLTFNPSSTEDGHNPASPSVQDGSLYRLEIGGEGLVDPLVNVDEVGITHDSFTGVTGAQNLGVLNQSGLLVSGSIDPRVEIVAPGTLPALFYPSQEGSIDEPGHRNVPIYDASHGLTGITSTAPGGQSAIIHNVEYNFRSDYGSDTQGNQLFNAITGEQRLRVREIFDLFSRYAGIRFVETADSGITVATGDTRVISDNTPTTSVNGLARGSVVDGVVSADAIAIVNSLEDWGQSEYGSGFFNEAMRQIGQVLGLWQSYDLPSVMGESLPGEDIFPSDYDILHLQQLYPRAGTEIDVYSFELTDDGNFQAETIAERLPTGASTLDTVVSVYDASHALVSRNDNSFGRDSRVTIELAAGNYFIAVSSTGNTAFDLEVSNSGQGGFTQGQYNLQLSHTPNATAANTIKDSTGTLLDGNRDGSEGGVFNFHFETASTADTIFVDKITTDSLVKLSSDAQFLTKTFQAVTGVPSAVSTVITLANGETTDGIKDNMLVDVPGMLAQPVVQNVDQGNNQITVSGSVTLSPNAVLQFNAVQVELDYTTAIQNSSIVPGMLVLPVGLEGNEVVPQGIKVVSNDSDKISTSATNVATIEESVTVVEVVPLTLTSVGDATESLSLVVNDATNITDGMRVTGEGILGGTTVNGSPVGNTVTLSQQVTVVDNIDLQFWGPVVIDNSLGVIANISVGMLVTGGGVLEGTTVVSKDANTGSVTFSKPAEILSNTALKFWQPIDVADTTGIQAGMWVYGTGVSPGTKVDGVDSLTGKVTLSKPASLLQNEALSFWFDTKVTLELPVVVDAGVALRFVMPGDGTLANPYLTVSEALDNVGPNTSLVRIVGNEGKELESTPFPQNYAPESNPYQYYLGTDSQGAALVDGNTFVVPAGVTMMVDEGSTFRLQSTNLEVGSSSQLVSRSGAAVQLLGTPNAKVEFTSVFYDATEGLNAQGPRRSPSGGDWGGIVLRADSDWQPQSADQLSSRTLRPVLNNIANAVISFGGGEVVVDAEPQTFSALQIEDTRPVVAFSSITYSADSAISATPNSFEESNGRVGPEFRGNSLLGNSTNGVFVAIKSEFGKPLEKLDVSARFASTEVTYVIQESLVLAGGAGSYFQDEGGAVRARPTGRLQIDPGVVLKSKNSRIELERGNAQLLAEGEGSNRVIFTSFNDSRFGAGGEFDTNGDSPNVVAPGDWGGIILNAGSSASIDNAYITLGGGEVPIEGGLDDFNVIEVHQADLRLTNSRVEQNASGLAETDRTSRGTNEAATVFVRGSQPIIVGNDFRNNAGALISINANSLVETEQGDSGRQVGAIDRFEQYDDNHGPLISDNRISNIVGTAAEDTPAAPIGSQFTIDVTYESDVPANVINAFDTAIARWEEVIVGDLSDQVDGDGNPVDDLSINVYSGLLGGGDGPGDAWANARGLLRRGASDPNPYLAYTGEVGVDMLENGDPANWNQQSLTNLAIHEIGHIIGFAGDIIVGLNYYDANQDFVGENALRQYRKIIPGAQAVPVALDTGFHWDKDEFGYEVMTPSVGSDARLSLVTAGLLDDIGYQVDYSAFDEYTHSNGTTLTPPAPTIAATTIAGVKIRAEEIVVESVWDDTDIVHVVTDEIIVNNFHTATGLRLESDSDASLVVKLDGNNAGFTASGEGADVDDRIGGTVQVVGQPGFPVILTSLADDDVGASLDALGFPVTDTNVDGSVSQAAAGDWRSLKFLPLANDRNVMVVNESESPYVQGIDENNLPVSSELLGILAPNYATGENAWESAQEKTGDENLRLGFEVHGSIAHDNSADVDIYAFDGTAGSEVWIDVDKTSSSLDTMVELLDASGRVLARSADSQNDSDSVTGVTVTAAAGGLATVAGEEATVVGAAASTTGVGAQVEGLDVTVTGVAARATGFQAEVVGIGAQVTQPAAGGDTNIVVDDVTGLEFGTALTLNGVITPGTEIIAINGNTISLDQPLAAPLVGNEWIVFDNQSFVAFDTSRVVFDVVPTVGVWVGDELSGNTVQSIAGVDNNIAILAQPIGIVPGVDTSNVPQNGLVAEYTFFGGSTDDTSGEENNGTNNGATPATDRFGGLHAMEFDGTNQHIETDSPGPMGGSPRAVSVWFRTSVQDHQVILNYGDYGAGESFKIEMSAGGGQNLVLNCSNEAAVFSVSESLTDDAWHHIVYMVEGGSGEQTTQDIVIYLDGNLLNTSAPAAIANHGFTGAINTQGGEPINIGGDPTFYVGSAANAQNIRLFTGSIDDVRVYDRALNPQQIDQLFDESTENTGLTTVTTLGLAASPVTVDTANIFVDNATSIQAGSTIGGTATVVTDVTVLDPQSGNTDGILELDSAVTISDDQMIAFSLAGGQSVLTQYIAVNDASEVELGTKITGVPGIPDDTTVVSIDLPANTLELSQPITVSLNDLLSLGFLGTTITVDDASIFADGMQVTGAGVPAGAQIAVGGIAGDDITLTETVDVANGEFLQFGFLGAAITTNVFFVDDTAVTVGSSVFRDDPAIDVTDPLDAIATVVDLDAASGAVTLNAPIAIEDAELLIFGFNGQPVTASRVVLDPATVDDATAITTPVLVNMVGAGVLDQEVPDGTQVVSFDSVTSNILELNQSVTVSNADDLGFGFVGTTVVLDDITGIDIGEEVTGLGVPAGTTVVNTSNDDVALDPNTIILSVGVTVEDAVDLTFNVQEFSVLTAAAVSGVAILPGTITGVVYDNDQAIQTFTSNRDGTLDFTAVGAPASRVVTGTVDYETGSLSLEFNTPPRAAIELRDVAFEYGNLSLETLGFAQNNGVWENGAFPLTKDAWRGGDYYTTNPRDAGMRVTLPGTQWTEQKYFVRVRSQPEVGANLAAHETNLTDTDLSGGKTSGSYELRLRTRQRDDKPGSAVSFADIRYPTTGIDVLGLPNNSPLVGTTGESAADNNTLGNAQQVGNLLTSDRNTISVGGAISNEADVDWYEFSLTYEDIQSLSLHNNDTKTFSTIFDIDYADGFRGDLTLSVFDSAGALIFVGRDSNIDDDQPGAGQGNDFDDLSRGSIGPLDPFIGSVQMPAGSTTPMTYYVAVSSNERLPSALDQTFEETASDPLARLEPVTSVTRVVEDHIGGTGYFSAVSLVDSPGIIDATDLSANVREFTLADLTLYVTTGGSLATYNPMTGENIATIVPTFGGGTVGDIDMRTDGKLFQYFGNNNDNGNNGLLRELNPGTGAIISSVGDGISTDPDGGATAWQISGQQVDALAIRRVGATGNVPHYGTSNDNSGVYYSIRDGLNSALYWARPEGNAAVVQNQPNGRMGVIEGEGVIGNTTGLQFLQDTGLLYGVSTGGQFYQVSTFNADATDVTDFSDLIPGEGGFQGLAAGPVNLYDAAFRNRFFAITGTGKLVCIDPTGASDGSAALIDNIFDTDGDGIGDSYLSESTANNARGLAFSPLDMNLWHATNRRRTDLGHGILGPGQTPPDNSRNVDFTAVNHAGQSMYFGIEQWTTTNTFQYGMSFGSSYNWLSDLTAGSNGADTAGDSIENVGGNYNLPGGAQGSLITNSFSLAGSEYADKPTLYFTYHLETEDFAATLPVGIRDSARVSATIDGGLTWTLLATNNHSARVQNVYPGYELPDHPSVSSRMSPASQQVVQELFDNTESWRQARIDLGEYAGESNIQLRFDFATAGTMNENDNSNSNPSAQRVVNAPDGLVNTAVLPLDSITGLEVGMIVRESVPGASIANGIVSPVDSVVDVLDTTIVAIDVNSNTITLAAPISALDDNAELSFFTEAAPKNDLDLHFLDSAPADTRERNTARGLNNNFEGFYVDDIIVGFAERGEMVTSSSNDLTTFYDIATPIDPLYPAQTLQGEYQLEIRRGTEYGSTPVQTTNSIAFADREIQIDRTFHTNDRFVTAVASPALVLARDDFNAIDGLNLVEHGNGDISLNGSSILLDDAVTATAGMTTHNMLAWNVELAGQPSAFLEYTVTLGVGKVIQPLPDAFAYNAWDDTVSADAIVGLPEGDGVAVSTDGGTNWTAVDSFGWTGSRVVDLVSQVGPLNDDTVIGFFRSGEVSANVNADLSIQLSGIVVTAAPPATTTGTLGDSNNTHEFEQGQFIIANNIISNASEYGVQIDAGRDTATDPDGNYSGATNAPHAGAARNLPVLLNSRLVPGVVVSNNVIHASGAAGVVYTGVTDSSTLPDSVRPFGKFTNNTIVGNAASGNGIEIRNNSAATLMNNVFADLATGVFVDASSRTDAFGEELTEIDTSAFYLVGTEVDGIDQEYGVTLTDSPFMDIAAGNYYPSPQTPIVDSALNALADRQATVVEKDAIGISQSPSIAPAFDLFGQRRADDPTQATDVGLGFIPFKDRGAIERVDRIKPTASMYEPRDGGSFLGLSDLDTDVGDVRLQGLEARGVQKFVIQLEDRGVGINKSSIVTEAVMATRDGVPLVDGLDYFFQFNANTNQVILSSPVVYGLGDYTIMFQPSVSSEGARFVDLAGNPLFTNELDNGNEVAIFTVELVDVPSAPTQLTAFAGDGEVLLDWQPPTTAESSPLTGYVIEQREFNEILSGWGPWTKTPLSPTQKTFEPYSISGTTNHALIEFRVLATNSVGQGPASSTITATPSQTQDLVGVTGNGTVSLSWKGPKNDGGLRINTYVVDQIAVANSVIDTNVHEQGFLSGDGTRAFVFANADVSDSQNELMIYNTEDPNAIELIGVISKDPNDLADLGIKNGKDIVVSNDGRTVYVVDEEGLKIYNVFNVASPIRQASFLQSGITGVELSSLGEFAILSTGQVIDVRNPNTVLTEKTSLGESWSDSTVVGDRLYTVNDNGLQIFNIQNLPAMDQNNGPSKYTTDYSLGGANEIAVKGDYIYVADGASGITVLDISELDMTNVDNPVIYPNTVSSLILDSNAEHIAVAGQRAYVGVEDNTLRIVDISNLSEMNLLEKRLTGTKSDVLISDSGSVVLAIDGSVNNEMYIVDTTDGFKRVSTQTVPGIRTPEAESYSAEITGLTKNVKVYFRVAATNERGLGTWSEYTTLQVPKGVPNPPIWGDEDTGSVGVVVNQTDGSIDLSWQAPEYNGGEPISRYVVEYRKDGLDQAGVPYSWTALGVQQGQEITVEEYNLASLGKGLPYSFRVAAVNVFNENGQEYDWSIEKSITTPDVPLQVPVITNVVPALSSLTVSWTAVVSDPLEVSGYVVAYSVDSGNTWTYESVGKDASPYEITGLDRANGPFTIKVAGKNSLGNNNGVPITNDDYQYSLSVTTQPYAPPTQVLNLTGIPHDAEVDLVWGVPTDDGGQSILEYGMEYAVVDGTPENWVEFSGFPTTTTGKVTGLTNGIAYKFRVAAKTLMGTGSYSDETGPITPLGAPLAPTLTGAAGPNDGEVNLTWTPNANNGGSDVTGYTVEYKQSLDASWTARPALDDLITSDTIPGLDKDKVYIFRVMTENSAGLSLPSSELSVTPFGLPEVPTSIQFSSDSGDGSLQLAWTAPTNDGGDLPVTYDVEYGLSSNGSFTPFTEPNDTDQEADIAGLVLGGSYTFRVRAQNARGESGWLEGQTVAPNVPAAISNLNTSTTGNEIGVVTLSWETPTAGVNDPPITGYQISQKSGTSDWSVVSEQPLDDASTGQTVVNILNLSRDNGDYTFRVAATNILTDTPNGSFNYQLSDPVKPLALPGAVRNLQVVPADGQVNLSWSRPLDSDGSLNNPGGESIDDYLVYYKSSSASEWQPLVDAVNDTTSAVVPGLVNGTSYDFKVAAKTRLGVGPDTGSASISPFGIPGVPTNIVVIQGTGILAGALLVTWDASSANGSSISDYHVEYAESSTGPWTTFSDGQNSNTGAVITGVPTGVDLYLRVAGENAAGIGSYSNVYGPNIALGAPEAPTGLTAAVNPNGTISLNWSTPDNNGGDSITDYVVEYRKISEQTWSTFNDLTSPLLVSVVTGLSRVDGPYEFRVKALNSVGTSPASASSENVTPLAVPSAVQNLVATAGNEQISVSWSAPIDDGGVTLTDYIIEYKATTESTWTAVNDGTSTNTSLTITSVTNGGNYQVRIRGVNSVGNGIEAISSTVTPVTNPDIPSALSVSADNQRATLTWTAPHGGGQTISDYVVEYRLAASSSWTTWNDGVSAGTSATITGLENSESYLFRVKAVTSFATGDYATSEAAVIGPKAAAPMIASLSRHFGGLKLGWSRIADPAGDPVIGYRVEYYDSTAGWQEAGTVDRLTHHYTMANPPLTPGVTYTFRVAAVTSVVGVGNFKTSNSVTF